MALFNPFFPIDLSRQGVYIVATAILFLWFKDTASIRVSETPSRSSRGAHRLGLLPSKGLLDLPCQEL